MQRKKIYILYLIFLLSTFLQAQTFECTIEQSLNPTLDSLYVSFYIQKTSGADFIMGYADFRAYVKKTAVDITNAPTVVAGGIWHNNANYSPMATARNIPNSWVSLQISGITPNGYVTSTKQFIGTIAVPIINTVDSSGVNWFDSEVYDESYNLISGESYINPPMFWLGYIQLISPTNGTIYTSNASIDLEWISNYPNNYLYCDNGIANGLNTTSPFSTGELDWGTTYSWYIEYDTLGGLAQTPIWQFEVEDAITVTYPNGGEVLNKNVSYTITWDDNLSENVKIDLYKGGVFDSEIISSTPSNGSYVWTIPSGLTTGTDYRIRISSSIDNLLYDESDGDFTIRDAITVNYPNGGEVLNKNVLYTITWDDNLSENVRIELYKGGVFNSTIINSTPSNGSYDWTIPIGLTTGTDYRIRITSTTNGTLYDESNADFSIRDAIIITYPNGGEILNKNTSYKITWNDNLSENVKIDLYKGGVFDSEIVNSTTSNGSYDWTIPSGVVTGTDYRIRITSTTNGLLYDESNANFTIRDAIIVTYPNGGEVLNKNASYTITWDDNLSENVKIDLYKGGVLDSEIINSTPSNGSYDWTIPSGMATGTDYRIRITSTTDNLLYDESNGDFTIRDAIIVTYPNGGEVLNKNASYTITWDDNISENVRIDLYKGGIFNSEIISSTPSNGTYVWTIPSGVVTASDYRIRITSTTNGAIFDESNANFSIRDAIIVTYPNGGELLNKNTSYTITWDDNLSENVRIELYKGGVFNSTITNSTPSNGSYMWTIPSGLSSASDYKIHISSTINGLLYDESDADFSIRDAIIVTYPNAGETLNKNATYTITWDDNISEDVKIELYKGGVFNSEIISSTPSNGSYEWTIPSGVATATDYRIRITSTTNGLLYDESDANFTIRDAIVLTYPNGGEVLNKNTSYTITWNDNLTENVRIELYKGGVFNSTIINSTPSNGSYDWTIPSGVATGTDYRIRVTSITNPLLYDESDANFSIRDAIIITYPNGGEILNKNASYTITWNDNISENVRIDLYKGGVFNSEIVNSTPGNGSYVWTIPSGVATASDYRIRITSTVSGAVFDESDANFSIRDAIIVTHPNGGEILNKNATYTITWDDNISENVKIDLYKGGAFDSEIINSTPSNGSYDWTIPSGLSTATDYRIRITSLTNPLLYDESDANFSIRDAIIVTYPNSGEVLNKNTSYTITWDDNISENVKIELYKGGVFNSEIISSAPSNGSYDWTIPSGLTTATDYRIRITSLTNPLLYDESNADFSVRDAIIVTYPNGGEVLNKNTSYTIIWDDNISENVKIELFKGGVFDSEIISSTPSNGSYNWTIPSGVTTGTDYRIRITSISNGLLYDESDDNFSIRDAIIVTYPNGGEVLNKNATYTITWDDNITENVRIELYKGGVFNSTITNSTPSNGSYDWTISSGLPNATDYTIRIISATNVLLYDESDSDFSIRDGIIVASPNGGEVLNKNTSYTITWDDNIGENVKIELFKGGVLDSEIISSTPSNGSYDWAIPSSITTGTDYRIRITSTTNPALFDESDANFTIRDAIIVTYPNGGEVLNKNASYTITWDDNLSENIKIELFKGGVFNSEIISSTPSNDSYNWTIPSALITGTDYKIRISSTIDTLLYDESNANFSIRDAIIVTYPNGGEVLNKNASYTITWDDNLSENVKIDLYKGGMFDSEIISSTPSNGSYVWAIPSGLTTGNDYKIRITSTIDSLLFDESDYDFTIRDAIIVTYPNGGEILNKNATYTITWDDNLSENVRIELYKGGIFNSTIVNSTLSNGSYNWTIPSGITNGTDYTIHISSTTNGLLFDESDSVFSIRDAIIITYPNGGERLNKNTTYSITWDDNLIEDVKIDLYKDGVFNSIIVNSTPSNGSFNWTIQPEIPIGTDYKVRITSTVNTLLYDESDFDFTIEDTLFLNLVFPISGTIDIPFEGDTLKWFSNGVEYDIYLGLDSNLTINDTLATKYTSQSIFTGALEQGTNYYWKVVAYKDAFIDTTDTWHFKTKIAPLYLALISPTNTEQDLPSGGVNLTWDTNGDTSIVYFGTDLSATNLINGLKQDSTSFFTGELINGLTYYWKVIVKRGTESDTIGIFSFKVELPDEFIIHPNYPNPFSYSTTIEYDLPEPSNVRIVIYDVSGKMVKELLNEYQEARSYLYEWDGTDGFGHKAGSGIYVLVINAESTQSSKKMFKSLKMSFVK